MRKRDLLEDSFGHYHDIAMPQADIGLNIAVFSDVVQVDLCFLLFSVGQSSYYADRASVGATGQAARHLDRHAQGEILGRWQWDRAGFFDAAQYCYVPPGEQAPTVLVRDKLDVDRGVSEVLSKTTDQTIREFSQG